MSEDGEEERRDDVVDLNGVRVCARRCDTCIFRPGNLMRLQAGRVGDMVHTCLSEDRYIPCHETLEQPKQAICRGFWDAYADRVTIGQIAKRLHLWTQV